MSLRITHKLLPILVNRTVIFFFLMCLFTLFLYLAGTSQGFIDSTQLSLLRVYAVLGIFLITGSICGIIIDLKRLIQQKRTRYLLGAGAYLFLSFFGIITLMMVMLIITVSMGNV
ncbi:MAG: hypothetical protein FWH12_09160 [Treponema sp.]|nr:hypothetical protein [Treponema sp.]